MSGVPSSDPLSTSTTCCTASNIGGSTHGRLRASFLTRNTHVSPGVSGPSAHGQVMSYAASPSRLRRPIDPVIGPGAA